MGHLDVASALRSMAAAASLAASSATSADVLPSPTSMSACESPQTATTTTTNGDDAATDQPLNLSTSKKSIFSATNLPPLAKIDRGKYYFVF